MLQPSGALLRRAVFTTTTQRPGGRRGHALAHGCHPTRHGRLARRRGPRQRYAGEPNTHYAGDPDTRYAGEPDTRYVGEPDTHPALANATLVSRTSAISISDIPMSDIPTPDIRHPASPAPPSLHWWAQIRERAFLSTPAMDDEGPGDDADICVIWGRGGLRPFSNAASTAPATSATPASHPRSLVHVFGTDVFGANVADVSGIYPTFNQRPTDDADVSDVYPT